MTENKTTFLDVARLIADKNIVALFQGRSEAGYRALGNRSILYDPRDPKGKDTVNLVKQRESFRPFAASVMLEHVHDWFDMQGLEESPFMMFAVDVFQNKQKLIPCVTHVDGTSRIQTVPKDGSGIRSLLEAWYTATGCPMLLNTSLNIRGEPMVNDRRDADRFEEQYNVRVWS
jgi:carbamoyltransferase